MAKEQDQTQQTEEENAEVGETKEDTTSTDKAVKTSEDFDKLADENPEDVEDTPSEDDNETKESKDSEDKDASKADDEESGKEADEDSDKDDDEDEDKSVDKTIGDETKVSDELAKRATDVGLTKEEIGRFDSDEELEKTVKIIEAVVKEEDAVDQMDSTQTSDTKKTEEEDTGFKYENEGDIDPEVLKGQRFLEQQNKELREKVDKLESDVQKEQDVRKAENQRQFIKRYDGYIDKLGLDFADVFGKGSLNDLSKRSQAYKNRDALRGRMYALGIGFQTANEDIPDEKQLFDLALTSLHGKKLKTVEGLRSQKKNKDYAKGAKIGRAATKKTGKLTGDQKAIKTNVEFDQLIDTAED